MKVLRASAAAIALVLCMSSYAFATEICGNGIDDDANGLTDEGCYPTLTTGVCESPLSCDDTGAVSWTTGSLHYTLPPDVAPRVPFGPGIGFRRFYTSMYTPGSNPTSVNKTPLGPGWQHNYLTWVNGVYAGATAVWHRVDGRDVLFTQTSFGGGFTTYAPQAGDQVLSFKISDANLTYVQLMTGETLVYNAVGQLIEIWDTLPTPNKVLITWDSTTNGNVSTVTDAAGKHRLSFTYSGGQLISTRLQHLPGTDWVTDQTTTYNYTYAVTKDATSNWYVPANATEWANLLEGTGIPVPTTAWGCQELSGNLAALVGAIALVGAGTYHTAVTGWSRFAVSQNDDTGGFWRSASSLCNPATTKCSMFALVKAVPNSIAASKRDVMGMGDANGAVAGVSNGGAHGTSIGPIETWNGGTPATSPIVTAAVHPWILSADPTASTTNLFTDTGTATPTWTTGTSANGNVTLGALRLTTQPASYLYAAQWTGTALTPAQSTTLINRIQNGPSQLLASVTIGGQLAQQYTYGASGNLLTLIQDAAGTQLMAFSYSSATPGRVNQLSTPKGALGFDYASSRTACSGKTMLYFNQGNTTSCTTDTDCGTGFLCGGQTDTGATGRCYRAARCLTTTSVGGESVVTDVAAVGPGGNCTGACAEIINHSWSGISGVLDQVAVQHANLAYTSMALCTTTGSGCRKGKPYQIGFGDNDQDPTNGGANRTMWIYYDTVFPDRIAEIRRPSNINPGAGPCSYTNYAGCERTVYSYGAVPFTFCTSPDNQLCQVNHSGYMLDTSGNPLSTPTTVSTTTIHDSQGRISKIVRPDGGKTLFDYYLSTDAYPYNLKDTVDDVDATHTLTTQFLTYNLGWGAPTTIKASNGMLTCQTYDAGYGYLASSRIPMAGQTDCTTPNTADLTTAWVRDTWLSFVHQLYAQNVGATTKLTRPDGSCVITTVDSKHRVSTVMRRDDCSSSSSGDSQTYQYTTDGQVKEIDTLDASGTINAKQLFTYYGGGQLQQIINPANVSVFEELHYDFFGNLTEVDGEASLTKSLLHYDGVPGREGRMTSLEQFKDASTSDTWALLYSWEGNQVQVTDGDSKVTGSVTDDFGHITKLTTPDLAGPTLGLYDVAGNLTSAIEDLGGGVNQLTHTYTYDLLSRPLATDDPGACATTGTAHAEVQRYYDALPSGVTCPMAGGCNHLQGHLAYVQTILLCSPTYSSTDGSLDQFTFYSYDAAGRLVEEYIKDDTTTRIADQTYTYTKNGALASIGLPSGTSVSWVYGSVGNNSDTDLVTSVSSHGSVVVDTVAWFPFGPLQQYNQKNTLTGNAVQTTIARDLAYRATDVKQKAGATTLFDTALALDARGRVTSRVYTGAATGVQSSYFLYDGEERVKCETTDLQSSCPTSGTDIKNSHSLSPPFTNAGDWKRVLRPIAGSTGGLINDFNTSGTTYGTTHRITDLNQSDGTPAFGHTTYTYDTRGSRSSDDNTTSLTNDTRTYTYDGRRNLSNVRGQYKTGGVWHFYDVASAFDAFNRRVFKSFFDETTSKTATWFFYYDPANRMTEVVYTPDTSAATTYSVFQLIWLGDRLVAYWQTDYPSTITSKRYVGTDESGRPIDMWNWPASGDTTRVWAINPDAWGNDRNITGGTSVFQPILFAGQYQDQETAAYENDGATVHRPGLVLNGVRTYDPQTGSYFQVDPLVNQTWSSYGYANSSPVMSSDPSGLDYMETGSGCESACAYNDLDGNDITDPNCISYCETIVDMGLGVPGDYYHNVYDTSGNYIGGQDSWGNRPCFDVTCHSDTQAPVGESWWYGISDGHAGPHWDAAEGDFLSWGEIGCGVVAGLGGTLLGGAAAIGFGGVCLIAVDFELVGCRDEKLTDGTTSRTCVYKRKGT